MYSAEPCPQNPKGYKCSICLDYFKENASEKRCSVCHHLCNAHLTVNNMHICAHSPEEDSYVALLCRYVISVILSLFLLSYILTCLTYLYSDIDTCPTNFINNQMHKEQRSSKRNKRETMTPTKENQVNLFTRYEEEPDDEKSSFLQREIAKKRKLAEEKAEKARQEKKMKTSNNNNNKDEDDYPQEVTKTNNFSDILKERYNEKNLQLDREKLNLELVSLDAYRKQLVKKLKISQLLELGSQELEDILDAVTDTDVEKK